MIQGIGVDLVKIERIDSSLKKYGSRFAERILSSNELTEFKRSANPSNFLAKRFAVKEAVAKAMGTGFSKGLRWQDIELAHLESGQPIAVLLGKAKQKNEENKTKIHISLTDEVGLVTAFAIIESL